MAAIPRQTYREHIQRPDADTCLFQYKMLVERARSEGKPIPSPGKDREELDWLIEHYPLDAVKFLPAAKELQRLGYSANVCRPEKIEPWPIEDRERFIETIDTDPDFAEALRLRLAVS